MPCSNFREGIKPAGRRRQAFKIDIYRKDEHKGNQKFEEQKALFR
jgi:hypothetical protein